MTTRSAGTPLDARDELTLDALDATEAFPLRSLIERFLELDSCLGRIARPGRGATDDLVELARIVEAILIA
jgi:hypothetical protein